MSKCTPPTAGIPLQSYSALTQILRQLLIARQLIVFNAHCTRYIVPLAARVFCSVLSTLKIKNISRGKARVLPGRCKSHLHHHLNKQAMEPTPSI